MQYCCCDIDDLTVGLAKKIIVGILGSRAKRSDEYMQRFS